MPVDSEVYKCVGRLLIIVVSIMVCLGGIAFFWRTRETRKTDAAILDR